MLTFGARVAFDRDRITLICHSGKTLIVQVSDTIAVMDCLLSHYAGEARARLRRQRTEACSK